MGFKLKNSGLEIKLDGYPIGDPGGEITRDHHILGEEEEPTKHSETEWAEVREVRGRWEGKGTSAGSSATLYRAVAPSIPHSRLLNSLPPPCCSFLNISYPDLCLKLQTHISKNLQTI